MNEQGKVNIYRQRGEGASRRLPFRFRCSFSLTFRVRRGSERKPKTNRKGSAGIETKHKTSLIKQVRESDLKQSYGAFAFVPLKKTRK